MINLIGKLLVYPAQASKLHSIQLRAAFAIMLLHYYCELFIKMLGLEKQLKLDSKGLLWSI